MASLPSRFLLVLLAMLACTLLHLHPTAAQIQDWNWAAATTTEAMAVYKGEAAEDLMDTHDIMESDEYDDNNEGGAARRSLYWKRHYYISYGALSANRVPCPPRSGRSYYTHNCYQALGPVRPYYRGCSCISRCRR